MSFAVLPHHPLNEKIAFHTPDSGRFQHVTMEDPALQVMTDLKVTSAVTVGPRESIEAAEAVMKRKGVRLLLVTDLDDTVLGILTVTDISGEKPLQFIQKNGGKHSDILVRDIMSAQKDIEVLQIRDVSLAKVGDVVETLRTAHRQHALVVDYQGVRNEQTLRGIMSLSQIARQLGASVKSFEVADTLSEIAQHTRR